MGSNDDDDVLDEIKRTSPDCNDDGPGWEWALVEVFGHRSHWGRIREEERFGAKMLRIDVPNLGDPATQGWTTHWYGGAAIFSLVLTDEATVLRQNRPYAPPSRARLPPPDDCGFDFDDDAEG